MLVPPSLRSAVAGFAPWATPTSVPKTSFADTRCVSQASGRFEASIDGCSGTPEQARCCGFVHDGASGADAACLQVDLSMLTYTCSGATNLLSELRASGSSVSAAWTNTMYETTGRVEWTWDGCDRLVGSYTNDGSPGATGASWAMDRVASFVPAPAAPLSTSLPSIVELAQSSAELSSLVGALSLSGQSAVLATLSGSGPFTVFAPTNRAFDALKMLYNSEGVSLYEYVTADANSAVLVCMHACADTDRPRGRAGRGASAGGGEGERRRPIGGLQCMGAESFGLLGS